MSRRALAAALLAALAGAAAAQEAARVEARWVVEPRNPAVGQPATCTLVVGRPRGVEVQERTADLDLDDSWVVLDARRPVALPDPVDEGRVVVRRSWEVASLEPGLRELPAFELEYVDEGVARRLRVRGPELDVRGVLAEGEDAPRPLRGYRDVDSLPEPVSPWPGLAGLAVLVAAAGALAWRRRRPRRPAEAPREDPLAWVAELEARPPEAPEAVRDAHYRLTRAVRERADERRGVARAALTDDEWLAAAVAEVADERREDLRRLFEGAARVKYGGERPTPYAVRETIGRGRAVLEALAGGPPGERREVRS